MIDQFTPFIKQFIVLIKIETFDNSLKFVEELAEKIISNLDLNVVSRLRYIGNTSEVK